MKNLLYKCIDAFDNGDVKTNYYRAGFLIWLLLIVANVSLILYLAWLFS